MKSFLSSFLMGCVLVVTLGGLSGRQAFSAELEQDGIARLSAPADEQAVMRMLLEKGVIRADCTERVAQEAVVEYLQKKMSQGRMDPRQEKARLVRELRSLSADKSYGKRPITNFHRMLRSQMLKFDTSEKPADHARWSSMWNDDREKTMTPVKQVKFLVLLADFSKDEFGEGPLHNEIAKPHPNDNSTFWVTDFGIEHYNQLLFSHGGYQIVDHTGKTIQLDSMVDYFLEASKGYMEVTGQVYGWFNLAHSEAYYGDDDPAGGIDNLKPGTPSDMVSDLLTEAAKAGVPFHEYDHEDPWDLDGDGDTEEPDGVIDHLVIVHAGVDQSGGGGLQGDDALWAHSSAVLVNIPTDPPMLAYNYFMQGENGSTGVFCHEFGHDLGLPDEYDTIYSGTGEPVGYYSLMSSGSWTGKPTGTMPSPLSPWARMRLEDLVGGDWINVTEIDFDDIPHWGRLYRLREASTTQDKLQVVKINLPQHKKILTLPHEGELEWWGGKDDEIDHTMRTAVVLPQAQVITLQYWLNYKIEKAWDYGFVQISTDQGETWRSLETPRTTDIIDPDAMPVIKANLPGYTGSSDGWVLEEIDLSAYAGSEIMLQFRYMTDWNTTMEGLFIDEIRLIVDDVVVLEDNAEVEGPPWELLGWTRFEGFEWKDHYYLVELRNYRNMDRALLYGYSWKDIETRTAEYYRSEPGVVVWYRDTAQINNWVGVHPGEVFLGVVDSHPKPIFYVDQESGEDKPFRTANQLHDASFKTSPVPPKTFYVMEEPYKQCRQAPARRFSDRYTYWYPESPSAGIKIKPYGLNIWSLGFSGKYRTGIIYINKNKHTDDDIDDHDD